MFGGAGGLMMNNNPWDLKCPKCKVFEGDANSKYGIAYCTEKDH